ncbi:MAG: hypothetical protein E5V61_07490 [Mesorhizobium sp.]|nr:MAG: hypothetical protein E5V61_07490 [Mesorhizobium sp.]
MIVFFAISEAFAVPFPRYRSACVSTHPLDPATLGTHTRRPLAARHDGNEFSATDRADQMMFGRRDHSTVTAMTTLQARAKASQANIRRQPAAARRP